MSNVATMPERNQVSVDRADLGDLQEVLLGLQGIFWALSRANAPC